MKGKEGTHDIIELTYSHTIPFAKELVSFILMTKKPHGIVCVKDLRCRGCLPKLKMEKKCTLMFNYELQSVTTNNTCQKVRWASSKCILEKEKGLPEKDFSGWREDTGSFERV